MAMNNDTTDNLMNAVLRFVIDQPRPVRAYEPAEYLGVPTVRVNRALSYLADRGLIVRIRHGLYSGDPELRRRALLEQLDRLTLA
jgi:predicted ArsR family transcriptional regulator